MATKEMENKLAECEDAVPARFASIGDTLIDMIEATPAMYLFTNEGWQLEGGGFNQTNGGGFNQTNGGVRDAIGAWPLSTYSLRLPNGEKDADRIKLPPSMCYMFRHEIEVESEDEDSNRF